MLSFLLGWVVAVGRFELPVFRLSVERFTSKLHGLVRAAGLEPALHMEGDFKSPASTYFATPVGLSSSSAWG